jgi:hypothetical protein
MDRLGLFRHPIKGLRTPAQVGHHLGIDIDTSSSYFNALESKVAEIAKQAKQLIGRATRNVRWLPVKDLQSLAGEAQYIFLGYPMCQMLSPRATLRRRREVRRPRPANTTAESRHVVVDN